MPDRAESVALVFQLLHLDDRGESVDALDQRIFDRGAEALREGKKLPRRQVLVAKEDHLMIEPRTPDRGDLLRGEEPCKVKAVHLGAERAGDSLHFDGAARHRNT